MPDVNVRGRYRAFTYDGTTPLDFTTYANNVSVIRRPNEISFVTLRQYIPGISIPFTTFEPGSSYVIVSREGNASFDMGPYTRVDRLPSTLNVKSPQYYLGLDKNSITIPLSVYALSINTPLSSVTGIAYVNGVGVGQSTVTVDAIRNGFQTSFTHFMPNSGYQLRNRVPFTFFAPLQSEMGDAYAWGENKHGQFGLGHLQDLRIRQEPRAYGVTLTAYNMYGIWENIEGSMFGSIYALSACGTKLKMFVTGYNITGQLGTGNQNDLSVFTQLTGDWLKVSAGSNFALALSSNGKLFSVGRNNYGQLGLGQSILSASTFTQVNDNIYSDIAAGGLHTLALDPNGALYGCGGNLYGELGLGRKTNSEFTLTREVSGGTFQLVRGGNNNSIVLSGGRMLGCGYQTQANNYGTTDALAYSTFVPEASGFTDIVDVGMSSRYILINRSRDNDYWWYTGSTTTLNSAPGIQNSSSPYRRLTVNRSSLYKRTGTIMPIYDNTTGSGNFYFTARGYLRKYFSTLGGEAEFYGTYSNLFGSRMGNNQTFFALTASNFRPTPTPTVTPTPTPSPVPFTPYNTLEVGVFGQSFSSSRTQLLASNTPGNLSNNFTLQTINDGNVPPDVCNYSTFDYEKTTTFDNIVGIAIATAFRNPRYLYRKVGNTWSYTLLPSNLDATSSSTYNYRGAETGTDSLFITPPHPQYSSSQGIYNLMFMRDEGFKEAISYDRGATWSISNFIGLNSEYQFSDLRGLKNKIFYSRTRDTNYEVQAVGYTDSAPMGSIPSDSLYFSRRFPAFSSPELIFDFGNRYIYGFDFKHDYYNIPTVASAGATPTSFGIYLHRKINGAWQTSIIKDNITNLCQGPYYQVPQSFSFYKRINSPIMSIEFDPTNADLIYIVYLKHILALAQSWTEPGFINVMCYNMKTNTTVFDEAVVCSKLEAGSLYRSNSNYTDIPSLFFDTSNNTLNLFFFGVEYTQSPVTINFVSYKMRRNGTNNWTAPTDLFPHTRNNQNRLNYLANSRELKTKY